MLRDDGLREAGSNPQTARRPRRRVLAVHGAPLASFTMLVGESERKKKKVEPGVVEAKLISRIRLPLNQGLDGSFRYDGHVGRFDCLRLTQNGGTSNVKPKGANPEQRNSSARENNLVEKRESSEASCDNGVLLGGTETCTLTCL